MLLDLPGGRPVATRHAPGRVVPLAGIAFSAWAAAFALGALLHLWPSASTEGTFGPIVAVGAFAVLLRPSAPVRLVALMALMVGEALFRLPELSNHHVIVAALGAAIVPWWLVTAWRRPDVAHDPGALYERLGPFLRVGFVLSWVAAAGAKLNTGFLDLARTCSVWVMESIPGVTVPAALVPAVIAATLAVELSVPVLLLFHRTRPFAIVAGLGFHIVAAFAGHASYSGFAWSFYLLFLPPATIARAVALARQAVPAGVRRAVATAAACPWWVALLPGVVWWLGWLLAPDALAGPLRRWGDALVFTVWASACAALLWRLRRDWFGAPGPRASLRVRNVVLVLGLVLLAVASAAPYLGLKTRASLTMFSNLRTEPGHWNHLLVPEAVRVFDWQDGEVRYLGSNDPSLDAAVAKEGARQTVLLQLRQIAAEHPGATVRYELDGVERVAAPVRSDPVLGEPLSVAEEWFGAMRPFTSGGTCQH
jgi:hypothetical protein